ncbi:enoyl-CoA hydratase-related protein [Rhodococcus globerulus]|uniref:enoyl-CoA hydratase-related protein n=1 Tax=Rhodococcus globerulus TaxID=33008 RepID=UPI000A7E8491|nr:enoyl-CoA hydratase-related protein [Rhodococcus globerulus]
MVSTPRAISSAVSLTVASNDVMSPPATSRQRGSWVSGQRLRTVAAGLFARNQPSELPTPTLTVLLLVTSDNGLSQRAALVLREAGHRVRTAVVSDAESALVATAPDDFDLIICPYLKVYIPEEIWRRWTTIIIHPGPPGDRGPSSLDWAIADGESTWGVTALQAREELDGGPVWAWRTFDLCAGAPKSAVYNDAVTAAAVECILEVVDKFGTPDFVPHTAESVPRPVASAKTRPVMKQADRAFSWSQDAPSIMRAINAADGFPGVNTELGLDRVFVYDAHLDAHVDADPGTILEYHHEAIRVATGAGTVWIGQARPEGPAGFKLPATAVVRPGTFVPQVQDSRYPGIDYHRDGDIGYLSFRSYNGAMSTAQCRRLADRLRWAIELDTKVLVLTGDYGGFSNGIHLNVIEAAADQAGEAWSNIKAINAVANQIVNCVDQVIVAAFTGNAGAGGVMLPLGADVVAARDGVVLNPHYATMGLFGSELHSYTLPARIGDYQARRLLSECQPISIGQARQIGLVDAVGPRNPMLFESWLNKIATDLLVGDRRKAMLEKKRSRLALDPVAPYEQRELEEMKSDMFGDRNGFAEKRRKFVLKL